MAGFCHRMVRKFVLLISEPREKEGDAEVQSLLEKNRELHALVTRHKNQITEYYKNKTWDKFKKLSNEYELIFTTPNTGSNISKHCPVSRSFFKLWEMLHDFNDEICIDEKMTCVFLAEGPGGFAEAFTKYRRDSGYTEDSCCGMTLRSNNNKNIPEWKLDALSNIKITYGKDDTGNLYNFDNILHLVKMYGQNSTDLVTADGGFDFSSDFNNQEDLSVRLILSEILATVCLQKLNGRFILKIYDIFNESTIKIVHLIKAFYDKIYILKPLTSRPGNAEKYLLCTGFKNNDRLKNKLIHLVKEYTQQNMLSMLNSIEIDPYILRNIVLYNTYYTFRQIYYIERTIGYINRFKNNYYNEEAREILNRHKQKSIRWCQKYRIPY